MEVRLNFIEGSSFTNSIDVQLIDQSAESVLINFNGGIYSIKQNQITDIQYLETKPRRVSDEEMIKSNL